MYEAVSYEGDPAESEEMRPQWFKEADMPLKVMPMLFVLLFFTLILCPFLLLLLLFSLLLLLEAISTLILCVML